MKISGVYKIENIVNGKVYVGQSSWLKKRMSVHLKEAANVTGANASSISMCANLSRGSSGIDENGMRLVWRFVSDYDRIPQVERISLVADAQNPTLGEKNGNAKAVLCVTTGEVFGSATLAAKAYCVDNSTISKKCRGGGGTCGKLNGEKLLWEYL